MKLANYKRGYSNTFDCSIHGTIYMSEQEWKEAYLYLDSHNGYIDKYGGHFYWNIFCDDIRRIIKTKKGWVINIRVPATEMLVNHFKLKNYKRGNYQLFIQY